MSLASDRIINTVRFFPSPEGNLPWRLETIQEYLQDNFDTTLSDTQTKRILSESPFIEVLKRQKKGACYTITGYVPISPEVEIKQVYIDKKGLGYKVWQGIAIFMTALCVWLQACSITP